jgi:plasmid stability protein
MPVNLSIKDVPDETAAQLRDRASRNHRSLQGELLAIIEAATWERPFKAVELMKEIRKLGLRTPSESTQWIREDRDSR